ncbi:MAG: hypothetical protein D6730_05105 [Bacteroidetes bacterium]|nr:MAG: hypothetical protein D6730_05105 [Bacteroidota bacterium]
MLNFFLWTFFIFFTVYVVFKIFQRQIITFFFVMLRRWLNREMEEQVRQYRRNYSGNPFEESIFIDDELKVQAPKNKQKKSVSADDIAEDIDFEEV